MYEITKLISLTQFNSLVQMLPTPRQHHRGRPRVSKEALVNGILQHVINGVAWEKIAFCGCSYVSCYRYFKTLQQRGFLKLVFSELAREKTDLTLGSIDATTVPAFEFKQGTGYDGHNRVVGTKISLYTDKNGYPADAICMRGNTNERHFILSHLTHTVGKLKRVINLDMYYMGVDIRRKAREKGVRINMKVRAQDYQRKRGPKFKFDEVQYKQRYTVERTNSWLKSFRALRLRRDYHLAMFKATVYLALILILMRY